MPPGWLSANLVYLSCRFGPYFVEPVIAGLDPKTSEPFIASLDLIGCPMVTEDFVVSGTCSEQMYGMCETLFRPDLVSITMCLWLLVGDFSFQNYMYLKIKICVIRQI